MSKKQHLSKHISHNDVQGMDSLALAKQKSKYERVRKLCKNLNRDRRHLRNKVDLLCKDLVGSNKQLVQSLGDLRFLCNFQHELIGENDLACLLHKAIQFLVAELEDTSAAIFLSATRKIEAHLLGSWLRKSEDLESVESNLQDTIIAVCQKIKPVILGASGAGEIPGSDAISGEYPYAMLGLPMLVQSELLGVVIFYRDSRGDFDAKEVARLQSCMASLGQQISAVQRLHAFLCSSQS